MRSFTHTTLFRTIGLTLISAGLLATTTLGHHGWSGNQNTEFELTGTVHEAVTLRGAHATMQLDVDGEIWDITLAPSSRTRRAGLTGDTIPVGAEVTVEGHRNSDPERLEVKTERVRWNDQVFDVYPNRD